MSEPKAVEIKICTACYIVCEVSTESCPECGGRSFSEGSDDDVDCCNGVDCDDCGCCDGGA